MKNLSGFGLVAYGARTKIILEKVTVANCQSSGVIVTGGAKLDATDCQFHQNGWSGVDVRGFRTTTRLTNCTSHHNKDAGVSVESGAVVDLMGEGTSVHDNRDGLSAFDRGSTINVYQPCVLNKMSHGNNQRNINTSGQPTTGGTIQQKDNPDKHK